MLQRKTRTRTHDHPTAVPKLVPAVDRTIQVLNVFMDGSPPLSVSELSRQLGINKSTLYSILNTLVYHHWLERDETSKTYRPGFGLYTLGYRAGAHVDLIASAHPFVAELAHELQETIMLTAFRDEHIVLIDLGEAPHDLKLSARIGQHMPYNAGAFGMVFNAARSRTELDELVRHRGMRTFTKKTISDLHLYVRALEQVRVQGYAIESEEYMEGICGVAVPIVNAHGQVAASLGVVGFKSRLPEERLETLAHRVAVSGREISSRLGASDYPAWNGIAGQSF